MIVLTTNVTVLMPISLGIEFRFNITSWDFGCIRLSSCIGFTFKCALEMLRLVIAFLENEYLKLKKVIKVDLNFKPKLKTTSNYLSRVWLLENMGYCARKDMVRIWPDFILWKLATYTHPVIKYGKDPTMACAIGRRRKNLSTLLLI
jgi:hypothetical protein